MGIQRYCGKTHAGMWGCRGTVVRKQWQGSGEAWAWVCGCSGWVVGSSGRGIREWWQVYGDVTEDQGQSFGGRRSRNLGRRGSGFLAGTYTGAHTHALTLCD